jgi:hypothetical protein
MKLSTAGVVVGIFSVALVACSGSDHLLGQAAGGTGGSDNSAGIGQGGNAGSIAMGGSSGSTPIGGGPAGGANGGAASGAAGATFDLVDCDPRDAHCNIVPLCPSGEVASVRMDGSCFGDCVKVERCRCTTAAECAGSTPNTESALYTCQEGHCDAGGDTSASGGAGIGGGS